MSWQPAEDPALGDRRACDAIETVIVPRARDLGGFEVRRALPSPRRQMVGPFIFWDQMGPADFVIGQGIDVRPHPHIGLATATYLFEGGDHPPRQPGHRRRHPSRRAEPDGRGPRHRPFRAIGGRSAPSAAAALRHPGLGGAAAFRRGGRALLRSLRRRRVAGLVGRWRDIAADRRRGVGRAFARADADGHVPGRPPTRLRCQRAA